MIIMAIYLVIGAEGRLFGLCNGVNCTGGRSGKISRAGLRGIEVDGAVGEVGLDMEGVRLRSWGY